MAGITLAQAEAKLTLWMAANDAVAAGQEYEIDTGSGSRRLKRTDASEILTQIKFWDNLVKTLSGGTTGRTRYLVPE
jgi:uncharacterized protein DUF6148